ncbi:phage Gp37/Gp68 family protein, partial [candidate division KSB1 bacterium]|nr:phage Gp37/Gp68 family protein [candidate division KSB1 bacterium]
PTTGCTKISSGCNHCYAEVMARRLKAMGAKGYENGFSLTLQPHRLNEPLGRKKPTMYFVNSMSDLFHKNIPDSYIEKVINIIERTPLHTYQILTKRAERMLYFFKGRKIPANAWLGVTTENRLSGFPRLDYLKCIDAKIIFLSIEPLLEDLGIVDLSGIDWVIVGGESGPKARPMKPEWVLNIKEQCEKTKTKFFFKQWGVWGADGVRRSKKVNGRLLLGKTWDSQPVRQLTL